MKKSHAWRRLWRIYILLLFVFVVIKFNGSLEGLSERIEMYSQPGYRNYNLIPLRTIRMQLRYVRADWARLNLLGNVLAFLPFGFLLPLAYGKRMNSLQRVFFVGLISVAVIELFQLITKLGSFDVDDILLNMLGILGGYWLLCLLRRRVLRSKKRRG
ncbi:MAG: VanZ family protein [Lachnospiraceae bacterium]|nr:VanZ family protein [Lachnospiraceae bacterium]